MTISRDIAPFLPDLRRFSRALSGSQESGDAFVMAALERLVANPARFPRDVSPRAALYRLFLDEWSIARPPEPVPDGDASAFDRNLAALSPETRQAFLLTNMEHFSVAEASTILGLDPPRFHQLLERGSREIAKGLTARILIIEDEPIIAMDLETIVEGLGHKVVGVARAGRQAVALAAERKPELIMADIELADGDSGIEVVNEIVTVESRPVVFITAHPRLYLGSVEHRPEPASILAKPFNPDTVRAAVSKALFFDRRAGPAA